MAVGRPFRRTVRQFLDGQYAEGGRWMYLLHPKFAQTPEHYIRAFLLLQGDLQQLFDFIEPDDQNLATYSFRTHGLLLRACVEVEANFKAILSENGYSRSGNWDMHDYQKVEQSHRLSAYEIKVPIWRGMEGLRRPFQAWTSSQPLPWYSAYNASKHDYGRSCTQADPSHWPFVGPA